MADDYESHRRRLQQEAEAAHRAWIRKLTPAQRAKLKSLGVLDPPDDSSEVGGHSPWQEVDAAESPLAKVDFDPSESLDSAASLLAERFGIPEPTAAAILQWHTKATEDALIRRQSDLLAIVVGGLIASKNIKIASAGLAYAAQLDAVNGLGCQAEYARSLGVSRSALSKSTRAWERDLGLQKSPHQKSAEACQTYSEIGKTNHWRTQKVSARALLARLRPPTSDPAQS